MDDKTVIKKLVELLVHHGDTLDEETKTAVRTAAEIVRDNNTIHITDSDGVEIATIDGYLAEWVVREGVKHIVTDALERAIKDSE
jgi:hypothetical protein